MKAVRVLMFPVTKAPLEQRHSAHTEVRDVLAVDAGL